MTRDEDQAPANYFFLSYAHTKPLEGEQRAPTDFRVGKLFDDLSQAVRVAAAGERGRRVGFFDGLLSAGEDWRERITGELGAAEVFVPLYSPSYVELSWPGREWSCFASRLAGQDEQRVRRHILPVLWTPMSRAERTPDGRDPRELAPDRPEYVENGLRAMCTLAMYRESYQTLVRLLAERIVRAARQSPLGPSPVRPVDTYPSAFRADDAPAEFAVAIAAPTARSAPPGRDLRPYGDTSADWRPFGERERLGLADYAVTTAERLLDSRAVVLGASEAARLRPGTPAVVLIDPWIAEPGADEGQLDALRRLFGPARRRWTVPLAVLDGADPQSRKESTRLLGALERVLDGAGALTSETARRGARGVGSIEEFNTMMPVLVAEAERQYIKHGSDLQHPNRPRVWGNGSTGRSETAGNPDDTARRSDA